MQKHIKYSLYRNIIRIHLLWLIVRTPYTISLIIGLEMSRIWFRRLAQLDSIRIDLVQNSTRIQYEIFF